jgi:biopolymer transport protein ExbB/TolQ
MNWKIWIITGTLLTLAGFFGVLWGMSRAFYGLGTAENAGLSAVGDGIRLALFGGIFFFAGIVPLVVGAVKLLRNKSKG